MTPPRDTGTVAFPRFLKLGAAVGGALVLAGAVVVVTASAAGIQVAPFAASPSPKPSASPNAKTEYCTDFVNHLASNLGKKPADVQSAAQMAFDQTVDDAVKNGQLTQQRGTELKQKFAAGQLCSGTMGAIGATGKPGDHRPSAAIGEHYMADVATALGISPADLKSQLASGKSLKDIAAGKGMDEATFRTKFIAAVKADLDQQVAAGKVTSEQEQMILQRLQTAPLPFWNGAPHAGSPRLKPSPTPSSTTT